MSDRRLRDLEREWQRTGDPQTFARLERERIRSGGTPWAETVRVLRALSVLADANVPIAESLRVVKRESQDANVHEALAAVAAATQADGGVGHTVEQFPQVFPSIIQVLVEAADEQSDTHLGLAFNRGEEVVTYPGPACGRRLLALHALIQLGASPAQACQALAVTLPQLLADQARAVAERVRTAKPYQLADAFRDAEDLFPRPLPYLLDVARANQSLETAFDLLALALEDGLLVLPLPQSATPRVELTQVLCLLAIGARLGAPLVTMLQALEPTLVTSPLRACVLDMIRRRGLNEVMLEHPELFPRPLAILVEREAEDDGNPDVTLWDLARALHDGVFVLR